MTGPLSSSAPVGHPSSTLYATWTMLRIQIVIQGSSDVGKELTEDEVQRAMDFCANVFAPTNADIHDQGIERVNPYILDGEDSTPAKMHDGLVAIAQGADSDAMNVLKKSIARKPLKEMWDVYGHFSHEVFEGYVITAGEGLLGLTAV